jgi:hypothetical protein
MTFCLVFTLNHLCRVPVLLLIPYSIKFDQDLTMAQAVGLSPRRSGPVHVGFVVDKVALGRDFLRIFRFPPVTIVPPALLIHHLGDEQEVR